MHLLAGVDYLQEKLVDAERLLVGLRDSCTRVKGATNVGTFDVINSLALVTAAMGKLDEAERLFKDAVSKGSVALGDEHPVTLLLTSNLAIQYVNQQRWTDAEPLCRNVLEKRQRVLGDLHPETLISMAMLGYLLAHENKPHEAKPLLDKALAGCRVTIDQNHETRQFALGGLMLFYQNTMDLDKLGAVMAETIEITRIRSGRFSAVAASEDGIMGQFFMMRNDPVRAEPYLRDCLTQALQDSPRYPRPLRRREPAWRVSDRTEEIRRGRVVAGLRSCRVKCTSSRHRSRQRQ